MSKRLAALAAAIAAVLTLAVPAALHRGRSAPKQLADNNWACVVDSGSNQSLCLYDPIPFFLNVRKPA